MSTRRTAITPSDATQIPSALPESEQPPAPTGRAWVTDLSLVLLLTLLVRFVSGAQRFTFLHTPDSEFYYSLGMFGSSVTDRAPHDSYFWTKLGIVLPLRGLSEVAAPLVALDLFHLGLTLLIAGSAYVVARLRWSRLGACVAAGFAALNTVILGFVGDPYASGAALAGLSLLLAAAVLWTAGSRPFHPALAALMGLTGAWLVMINPYAVVVGAAGCVGILLANARAVLRAGIVRLAVAAGILLACFALGFGIFLGLGWLVFPGLSWFDSLNAFLSGNDLANWAAKDWAWLPSETSLLVPAAAAAVSLVALAVTPKSVPVRTGAGLVWVTLTVSVGYKLLSQSNVLEHSVYSSMLWPAALLGLVLLACGTGEPGFGWLPALAALVAPLAWILAGRWTAVLSPPVALAIVGVALAVAGSLLVWGRSGRVLLSAAWPVASVGLVLLVVLGSAFQVLQNGRPQDPTKLHRRVLYSTAFLPTDVAGVLEQDWRVERWLIDSTSAHEQVLVWNEPGTRSAAAMQLWGPNTAGTGFGGPLGASGMATIRRDQPDLIVTYAADPLAVDDVRAELETEWTVADPTCQVFPGADVPAMQGCILRLQEQR